MVVVVVLPDPFREMGRGGTPRKPNSRATPQGLDVKNGSGAEDGAPERLGCGTVKEEASQILQRVSADAARRIFLPFYPA